MPEVVAQETCCYELDDQLRLTAVDEGWTRFAIENGAPDLAPPAPLGKRVLDAISDPTTRLLYNELYQLAARTGKPITVPIRCDSPQLRRQLDLIITPIASGFRVESVLRWATPNVGGELLDPSVPRDSDELLRLCSWCKRMQVDQEWHELDEAARRLRLFEHPELPLLTHGMCERCADQIRAMLDGLQEHRFQTMVRIFQAAVAALVIVWIADSQIAGQQPAELNFRGGTIALQADDIGELRAWDARITSDSRSGALRLRKVTIDPLVPDRVVERYQQYHGGVRIFGGDVVRDAKSGVPMSIFGALAPDLTLSTQPGLSSDAAARALLDAGGPVASALRAPELVILPLAGGDYRLVYQAPIAIADDVVRIFVDASSGAELRRYSEIKRQNAIVGTGTGALGDTKKMSVESRGGTFVTVDTHRPPSIQTFDLRGNLARFQLLTQGVIPYAASDLASDSDNRWTDPAVVDAHTHVSWTYDFFFKRFGRHGLDDRDSPINIVVNAVTQQAANTNPTNLSASLNASWCGVCGPNREGRIYFGNGLPPGATVGGQSFTYFAGALDIAAHELTHGVGEATANLIYYQESGALDEAFADMMGKAVEFFYHPPGSSPGQADYTMGKDISRAVRAGNLNGDRSMANPQAYGDPDHYSRRYTGTADNAGVHTNSGIANHAYYLAIEGGTHRVSGVAVQGVGAANREQIEKVFFRAFTTLLPSNATFMMARAATIQAARDLYASNSRVEQAVTQAWTAVGVPDQATVQTVTGTVGRLARTTINLTASATGRLNINLVWPDPIATDLDIYLTREGCAFPTASCIVALSEGPVTSESISFAVRAGERYWLTVVNFDGPGTPFTVQSFVAAGL